MVAKTLSPSAREQIAESGPRLVGEIGGQPKTRYFTPDGREIFSAPSWHEYTRKDANGKVLDSGVRDANLDKGWLMQKPERLKLYCPHCDRWHDNENEVAECQRKRDSLMAVSAARMKKEQPSDSNDRLDKMEIEMGEIKALLLKLVGGK
ncbi:hypothetical protein LCGC14_0637720 [marine sediment metagenome]|uniref:Uncharacterized protein n=1 Tax=marine sediment metagenome TaxID=412755 RepID=A0A0F9TLM2_9ZZZZ